MPRTAQFHDAPQAPSDAPGADTRWPLHRPGSALTFPRDEGWHALLPGGVANPSLRYMEWYYLNAHLDEQGGLGRHFTFFGAYFTQNFRLLAARVFDREGRFLGSHHAPRWGLLRPSSERLDLSFRHATGSGTDHWSTQRDAAGALRPFASRLHTARVPGELSADLSLSSRKATYEAGGIGYLPFGRRGAFSYYSHTRLAIEGRLTVPGPDGDEEVPVRGLGWFDHQWGPFYVTPFRNRVFEGYEWMSVQLDSGDDLLLTTVWEPDGQTPDQPSHGGVGLVRADGSTDKRVGSRWLRRTRFWEAPGQHCLYAAGWELTVPEWGVDLRIRPKHPDQMMPIVAPPSSRFIGRGAARLLDGALGFLGSFWEGACAVEGTFAGRPVRGVAFAELIKRYQHPRLEVQSERVAAGTVIRWRVENPDAQVPLAYRVYVEDGEGGVLAVRTGLDVPVFVLDTDEEARLFGRARLVRIVAHSEDGSLSGTATHRLRGRRS